MVDEDAPYQVPQSSQPPGFHELQTELSRPRTELDHVRFCNKDATDLFSLFPDVSNKPPPPKSLASSSTSSLTISAPRKQGNPKHPAYQLRHAPDTPVTQDPETKEALKEFSSIARRMLEHVNSRSIAVAAKRNPSLKENASGSERTASPPLKRRRTIQDIQVSPQKPRTKLSALKSQLTDSRVSSTRAQSFHNDSMDEDKPVAGPSRPRVRRPSLTEYVNAASEESDEDSDGMPSCTPTPPPKKRDPQRSVSSASSSSPSVSSSMSKGKSRQFSAFSESPTSLAASPVPLARRHSENPSASYGSSRSDSFSPVEQGHDSQESTQERSLSPVIPSPVALARQQSAFAMPPPPLPAPARAPSPPSFHASQGSQIHYPHSQASQIHFPHSQAPAPARLGLPPTASQSPALTRPFAVPSLSQAQAQGQGALASQLPAAPRPARHLGMGRAVASYGGVRKHQVPQDRPRGIAPFKPPFKVTPAANRPGPVGSAGGHSAAGPSAVAAAQRSLSPAVPDPPNLPAFTSSSAHCPAADVPLAMCARRPEPESGDEMDLDDAGPKEADSSYGDVPFDFDPAALDEVMSVYDT